MAHSRHKKPIEFNKALDEIIEEMEIDEEPTGSSNIIPRRPDPSRLIRPPPGFGFQDRSRKLFHNPKIYEAFERERKNRTPLPIDKTLDEIRELQVQRENEIQLKMVTSDDHCDTGDASDDDVLLPVNASLDEIIGIQKRRKYQPRRYKKSRNITVYDKTPGRGPRRDADMLLMLEKERIATPREVLRLMSLKGFNVEWYAQEVDLPMDDDELVSKQTELREKRWRVQYNCDDLRGYGIAPRKEMAMEAAAFDLVQEILKACPNFKLPPYNIPPGCCISPFVYDLLDSHCVKTDLTLSYRVEEEFDRNKFTRRLYTCTCTVGRQKYFGMSIRSPHFAKKYASKVAYESETGKKFPYDEVIRGKARVKKESTSTYQVIFSGAHHIYIVDDDHKEES